MLLLKITVTKSVIYFHDGRSRHLMDNSEDQVELTNVENPLLKEEFKESCVEADHESESPLSTGASFCMWLKF